jgi:hypothetical protein
MKKANQCSACGVDARHASKMYTSKNTISIQDLVYVDDEIPSNCLPWVCDSCYHKLEVEPQLQPQQQEQKHDGRKHNHGHYKKYEDCEQAVRRNKKECGEASNL